MKFSLRSHFQASLSLLAFFATMNNSSALAKNGPQIGMQYITWFSYDRAHGDCSGTGWRHRPFQMNDVASLVFGPQPFCYSSMEPETARVHARYLDQLGVDFVIIDETNLSKTVPPESNPIFQSSIRALEGFKRYSSTESIEGLLKGAPKRIRAVFQFSLTCWAEQCHGKPGDRREIFTYSPTVQRHIESVQSMMEKDRDMFYIVDGKPLIIFYLNEGNNVYKLDGTLAFNGPGNLIPTPQEFNPIVQTAKGPQALRDIFTIRYAIQSPKSFDYSSLGPAAYEIWPFGCLDRSCRFSEAAYSSVYSPALGHRSLDQMRSYLGSENKPYIVFRVWNEFSSTDEVFGRAFTIEPNTKLHLVDSTPGQRDPWYFFNGVKRELNLRSSYVIAASHSRKCLDIPGASSSNGTPIQQWDCGNPPPAQQRWSFVPLESGLFQIVAQHSRKCLEVRSASDGAQVVQSDCQSLHERRQLWHVQKDGKAFRIVSQLSGKCLDVTAVSQNNGSLVQQYTCLPGQDNQRFEIR